jgi:hypothetical protein
VACNHYYTTFAEFRKTVQNVLNNITAYRDELSLLMTERFQLFTRPKDKPVSDHYTCFFLFLAPLLSTTY